MSGKQEIKEPVIFQIKSYKNYNYPHKFIQSHVLIFIGVNLFFKFYLFLEIGEGREKERERNFVTEEAHPSVASHVPPTRDLAHIPGMGPDWESK